MGDKKFEGWRDYAVDLTKLHSCNSCGGYLDPFYNRNYCGTCGRRISDFITVKEDGREDFKAKADKVIRELLEDLEKEFGDEN